MTTTNNIPEADNSIEIEGVLLEKDMEYTEVRGKEAIRGKLSIRTDENSVHTVEVFSYLKTIDSKTKQERDNGIGKGLVTVKDTFKAVADEGVGEDNADKVRVDMGSIRKNEYYGRDGQLKSYNQYSAQFINRVKAGEEYDPRAKFGIETYIQNVIPEIRGDEETGRLIINGLVPLYGGKIVPIDFVVENEKAVAYIEQNYEVGNTVKIFGRIVNTIQTVKTVEEVAFGDDVETIKEYTVRELLVTGGTPPYDEENPHAYTTEQIQKALVERETELAEKKAKAQSKSSNKSSSSKSGAEGFSVAGKAESLDIPF